MRRAVHSLVQVDRGLLYTAATLLRRPGTVVRDYLEGRTVRYTGPFRYLLIMVALTTFISVQSDVPDSIAHGLFDGLDSAGSQHTAGGNSAGISDLEALLRDYLNVFLVLGIPFMAVWTRLFFRSAGMNIAEHLVLHAYLFAQICLLTAIAFPLSWMGVSVTLREVIVIALATMLFVWASVDTFGKVSLEGAIRALGAWTLTVLSYMVGAGVLLSIILAFRLT